MMNPIRIFAKQTIKSGSYMPGSGQPEVDQAMAAHLCGGMRREWYLAARLRWGLDWSVANELEYMLWMEGSGVSYKERWRVPKGKEYVRKMAGLAIAEIAEPKRYAPDARKAEWMDVSASQFSRLWGKRYNAIYSIIEDWSSSAYSYVMMRQRYDKEAG